MSETKRLTDAELDALVELHKALRHALLVGKRPRPKLNQVRAEQDKGAGTK